MIERLQPLDVGALPEDQLWVLLAGSLLLGVAMASARQLWRVLRIGVTVVHELGHAVIGLCAGRRLLGIRVSWDMSGETVTSGRPSGPGLVLTTLAGYPVPPLVGAAFLLAAGQGYSQFALLLGAAMLVLLLVTVRSGLTALAFLGTIAVFGMVWWADRPLVSTVVAIAVGVLLLVGGLRAIGSLIGDHARGRGQRSDAAALARLTPVPAALWLALFALIAVASAAVAGWSVAELLELIP